MQNSGSEPDQEITQKQTAVNVGGNINNSLAGKANIEPFLVLKEAMVIGRLSRLPLGLATLIILGVIMVLATLLAPFANNSLVQELILPLLQVLLAPLLCGLSLMGIKSAVGIKLTAKQVFDCLPQTAVLVKGSLIMMLALLALATLCSTLQLPVILQMLIVMTVNLLMSFTLPLIFEKKLAPIAAIKLSVQVSVRYLHKILFCLFAVGALFSLGLLPLAQAGAEPGLMYLASGLFIILIAVPFYFTVNGILYRQLFGVSIMRSNKAGASSFSA